MDSTTEHIASVVSQVLRDYDVSRAYLFGSFARGDQNDASDIDLRFECGSTMTYSTLLEISDKLERQLGRQIEIVTNPPEHMRESFRKRIQRDEVPLYEAA